MEFSDAAIEEFIAIYQRHYSEKISRDDAISLARQLVNLYRLFLLPLPKDPKPAPVREEEGRVP